MRPFRWVLPLALLAGTATAQSLDCPGGAGSTRPCEAFHFHAQLFRPDPRGFVDVWGVNQFATQSACERARDAAIRRNLAVVDYFKRVKNDQRYEPDRVGPCHCDMSVEKSNPRFLTPQQRTAQLRQAEEVRQRVRERLLDSGLKSESDVVRGLLPQPFEPTPLLGGPKLVPPPPGAAVSQAANPATDLRMTRAIDASRPVATTVDLPLVDIPITLSPAELRSAPPPLSTVAVEAPPAVTESPAPEPAPQPQPASEPPQPAASPDESAPEVEEAAGSFIAYETERVQNVLVASSVIGDETIKSQIFEAVQQRIRLLSNLRALIEGSGYRSRLASGARDAKGEAERLAFVAKLFGDEITPHWAPKDATDVILRAKPEIDADAERVLRDASGKFSDQQKRRALYVLLAKTQPTEDQKLWLGSIIDSFLQ